MKKLLLILIFVISNAKEIYFLPFEGKQAEKRIYYLFSHAKKNIKILIYAFTNKKLSKALKKAAKRGVKIIIIADKKEAKYKSSKIPNLAIIKNIQVNLISGKSYKDGNKAKMHVKMSIVDDKYLITGSANYTYSAFYKNYEYILIDRDSSLIKKFENFFNLIKNKSIPFRLSKIKY